MLKTIMNYFREEAKDALEEAPQEAVDPYVGEPIRTFVECVKKNPRRFRCRETEPLAVCIKYEWQKGGKFYTVADKKLGDVFQLNYYGGRLHDVLGVNFNINWSEYNYLHEELSPIFMAATERKGRIASMQHQRKWLKQQEDDKVKRAAWLEKYQ